MSFPPDWPASTAASAIREDFLARLGLEEGVNYREPSENLIKTLTAFHCALANPSETAQDERGRLEDWLVSFSNQNNLAFLREVLTWQETRRARKKWPNEPKLVKSDEKRRTLGELFKGLLGIAIMRPLVDAGVGSPIFYAAIDRPELNLMTKCLILDSVLVPPGSGSIGICLRAAERHRCVGISFADYAGVVEWQDLVQGQVSILMVAKRGLSGGQLASSGPLGPGEPRLPLIFMAFMPIPFLFSASPLPIGKLTNLATMATCNSFFLGQLQRTIQRPHLCDMVAALTESSYEWRKKELLAPTNDSNSEESTDDFSKRIVRLLIPDHFTDLPVPLAAAFAIVRDLDQRHYRIAHLRVTSKGLQALISEGVKTVLGPHPEKGIAIPNEWSPILSFTQNPANWIFQLSVPGTSDIEAIWWLHVRYDCPTLSSEKRDQVQKWVDQIHAPLHRILNTRDRLLSSSLLRTLKRELKHTLPLFGEWKLRDNVAHAYYNLVSRVLLEQDATASIEREKEFFYILRACLAFAGEKNVDESDHETIIGDTRSALRSIKATVAHHLLGASAMVRTRSLTLCPGDGDTDGAQQILLARLLTMLHIQHSLSDTRAPESLILEEDRLIWGDRLCGKTLQLQSWGDDAVYATVGGTPIRGNFCEWSNVQTTVATGSCEEWIGHALLPPTEEEAIPIAAQIGSQLGVTFEPLGGARVEDPITGAAAQLFIAYTASDTSTRAPDEIKECYQDQLRFIANLFKQNFRERFIRARNDREQAHAEMAEQLISSTAHVLKIPLTVVRKLLNAGEVKKADTILQNAMSLVTIGQYIHDRERHSLEPEGAYWAPVSAQLREDHSIILDVAKLEQYFDVAKAYVESRDKGPGGIGTTATLEAIKKITGDRTRLPLESSGRYRLMRPGSDVSDAGNPVTEIGSQLIALIDAVFFELFVNAIQYAKLADPYINVAITEIVDPERRLQVNFHNNLGPDAKWRDNASIQASIRRESGLTGITTAMWAIDKALGWNFPIPTIHQNEECEPMLRITFDAPLKGA
jgi:hypothetical protein